MLFQISSNNAVWLASLSVFLGLLGATFTFPYQQSLRESLGCDVLCYGNLQSARSLLSLLGATLAGRLSDRYGRLPLLRLGLCSSLLSYAITLNVQSLIGLWLSMIPSALLNQNYNVLKALISDYQSSNQTSESDRASALGRLGMAAGLAFMIGPILGTTIISSHNDAVTLATAMTMLSGVCLILLPIPALEIERRLQREKSQNLINEKMGNDQISLLNSILNPFKKLITLPVIQSSGAQLLMLLRHFMGLAYHIFMTVWPSSLKERFDFAPQQHAYFMGWIGLWYAASQGVIAHFLIKMTKENPTIVMLGSLICLALGRVIALYTSSIYIVYIVMAVVIIALGVVNTLISSACSRLADRDQVGGLFGVMEAIENVSGLIGPTLGGFLYSANSSIPIVAVVVIYTSASLGVALFYHKAVVLHNHVICKEDKNE